MEDAASEARGEAEHTIFTEQWPIYRRVVEADYMSHRALFDILHNLLAARREPFSFLDLASGDACCSLGALCGTGMNDYTAVDLSEPALRLAAKNASSLACKAQTAIQDFQDYLDPAPRTWDVVFIGFSYHHLVGDAKLAFARKILSALNAKGEWIFFEPILCASQTRADYLRRWKASLQRDWKDFNPEEKLIVWEHVSKYDFPESRERFEEIAAQAGFAAFEHLYTDPYEFYGAFRAIAS